MKFTWITSIFAISFCLIAVLKSHEVDQLSPFHKAARPLKPKNFQEARKKVSKQELATLSLWESMLTGRSRSLSKEVRRGYTSLGLSHLFTPSGFHLNSVLSPVTRFLPTMRSRRIFLITALSLIFFLVKLPALRRMCLVKLGQNFWGNRPGFILALIIDMLFGSFTTSTISFSYSLMFLGIVYSGKSRLKMIWFFFMAQMLICYFNQSEISLLLLLINPLLNIFFGLAMPLLFLMSIPLWDWQLWIGLKLTSGLQTIVTTSLIILNGFPFMEVTIFLVIFLVARKKFYFLLVLIYCNSLNTQIIQIPLQGKWSSKPSGTYLKTTENEAYYLDYWSDGKCWRKLIGGVWLEKCSPYKKRGSKR